MRANQQLLTTAEDVERLCETIRAQSKPSENDTPAMVALDTEFIRESTFFPITALIQVATENESWLLDPLVLKSEMLKPFFDLLTDKNIVKVLHAAQADQECFYTNYGLVATPTLDTAVAASLTGYGDSIGLAKLLKDALGVHLRKGHARTDWTVRPIPEQLSQYAHLDVHHLIPLARKLIRELDAKGRRAWAFELTARMENTRNYEFNPDGIAAKIVKNGKLDRRGYATLRELLGWRERRVRDLNVPRRRVAEDDILVDLSNVRPKDLNHLSTFRGLNKGEFKNSGTAILAAIKRAADVPEDDLPLVPRPEIPDPREARMIELIQCFLKMLADNLQISARHLTTADDLLPLLRGRFATVDEVVRAGHLSAGASRLIGDELLAMVQGKRSLGIRNGVVVVNQL